VVRLEERPAHVPGQQAHVGVRLGEGLEARSVPPKDKPVHPRRRHIEFDV